MTDSEESDEYDRLTYALGIAVLFLVTLGVMALVLGTGWLTAKTIDVFLASLN